MFKPTRDHCKALCCGFVIFWSSYLTCTRFWLALNVGCICRWFKCSLHICWPVRWGLSAHWILASFYWVSTSHSLPTTPHHLFWGRACCRLLAPWFAAGTREGGYLSRCSYFELCSDLMAINLWVGDWVLYCWDLDFVLQFFFILALLGSPPIIFQGFQAGQVGS